MQIGYVDSYSTLDGHYFVRIPGYGLYSPPIDAYLVSTTPDGGMKGAPTLPKDTEVLMCDVAGTYYIIGFPQHKGPVLHNSYFPVRPVDAGDQITRDSAGHQYGINKDGSFFVYLTRFANFALNPILRRLTMALSNLRINLPAGSIEYKYDAQAKTSQIQALIYKTTNLALSMPGKNTPDYVKLRAGDLSADSDAHMVEVDINQDHTIRTPAFTSTLKLGKQTGGKWFDMETSAGAANPVTYNVTMDNTGVTQFNSAQGNNTIALTADINKGISVTLNGNKATLTIDPTGKISITNNSDIAITTQGTTTVNSKGNVTFKTPAGATIKLGGTGNEQRLVTKAFVNQVFKSHVHSNGNQGSPTGTPMIPIPDPNTDSPNGPFTFTTMAE